MKAMIYLGKATPKIVNGLKSMSDDKDYMVYTSVSNFVQEAELRHLSFNRVVFNNKFVPRGEADFIRLNEFIHEFSNATELVMVINYGDKESEDLFNKYFSSPIHSCAIVKNAASMDFFRDIVSLPIADVKARYYTLDKGSAPVVTARSVDTVIGGFKGGSKKSTESVESAQPVENAGEPALNTERSAADFESGFDTISGSVPALNPESSPSSTSGVAQDFQKGSDFSLEGWGVGDPGSATGEDFSEDDEDDLLSVGEFGRQHSDTDMFDEEEPDEIIDVPTGVDVSEEERKRREELEELNRKAAEIQEQTKRSEEASKPANSEPIRKPVQKRSWSNLKGTPYLPNRLNFLIGVRSSAQQIVDDAVRMMEEGMRVLIIDMDFVNNGILSFISVKDFYKEYCNGYSSGKIFVEENIGVLSGGYGYVPTGEEVHVAFGKNIESYDIVLVDCPVSSLSFVTPLILDCNNIIIVSDSDPSEIVATSLALTSRKNCSLELERVIMSKGKPILVGDSKDLVKETVSNMFFANGCWLN